jgi:hypothetical protein
MKKISKKQTAINRKLKEVYEHIADTRGHYCTGCGRSDVPLSHSHYISRSRRKDLELDPYNITYHCLSISQSANKGCHDLWEGGLSDKQKLLDYHKAMEYILENDTELYFLMTD